MSRLEVGQRIPRDPNRDPREQATELTVRLLHQELDELAADDKQRQNFACILRYFEDEGNLLPDETLWAINGALRKEPPTPDEIRTTTWKAMPDGAAQMAQKSVFGFHETAHVHQLFANIKLLEDIDSEPIRVAIVNDTGSNRQTVLPTDMQALGFDSGRHASANVLVTTAGGNIVRVSLWLAMQIVKENGDPLTHWYIEAAVVGEFSDARLSGNGMRNHLYFATAPGNAALFVAAKKHGLVSLLPTL
ncbi:hypothetical protein SPI_06201 [Niveomyces insectorum RCEF 264]|uniref:Uncharacterized protein n=1 Tax=Niveomyces insectorum RCEF 264 TaxID=1081102 RepID=A0A167RW70_9HYPO|nr:hypothetical protein SPI_06201 [Niveomyces insectorum RCEF 264]